MIASPVVASIVAAIEEAGPGWDVGADELDLVERLRGELARAQRRRVAKTRRGLVVVAGDQAWADPGIALGAAHPTTQAVRELVAGRAAVARLAANAGAILSIVDAGMAVPEAAAAVVDARCLGETRAEAVVRRLEAGIALALASAEAVDVLGLGAVGLGVEASARVVLASRWGAAAPAVPVFDGDVDAMLRAHPEAGRDPLAALAAIDDGPLAVMVGLCLGAVALGIAVVLDDAATAAALTLAAELAPGVVHGCLAAQRGREPEMAAVWAGLGRRALVDAGIGQGEGAGAAMVLAMVSAL